MIIEIAILQIKPELNEEFEADFIKAKHIISSIEGFQSISLRQCVEHKLKYLLQVHWDTVEAHTENFRKSDGYLEWKKLLHHYYDPFPTVEHFDREVL